MGSMITLGIERMEIDWGKNNNFINHSRLFQLGDIKQIPYYYVNMETDEPIVEMKEGYARKLGKVKQRLDLLGYDLNSIKKLYQQQVTDFEDYGYQIKLSFKTFFDVIKNIDISQIDTVQIAKDYEENGYDLGEYVRRCILTSPEIQGKMLVEYENEEDNNYAEYDLSHFLENIDPYITIRILAENEKNHNLELRWSFADIVENGWVKREEVVKPLPLENKIIIVTEGSSDSFIIKKTIEELYPDINDFFSFVDMKENYPFTGVGNLYNFCLGLCQIGIQNNIIAIFDNDTVGTEKYNQTLTLEKPKNFLIIKLPDNKLFLDFNTIGPHGESKENINGRAIAIECFLDFNSVETTPRIRWTSFNKKSNGYQGELENKDNYVVALKGIRFVGSDYDVSKLEYLIDYIMEQWINRK